jgi:hypothetical protein
MAQFIKPPGYGEPQFKPTLSERYAAKRNKKSAAEKREGMSERHLALIRQLPCCITGKPGPSDPHHLKQGLAHERGVGRKATDRWAVPLCRAKHEEVERLGSRREHEWFAAQGIDDPLGFAAALWRATGDLERMRRIVFAHMSSNGGRP